MEYDLKKKKEKRKEKKKTGQRKKKERNNESRKKRIRRKRSREQERWRMGNLGSAISFSGHSSSEEDFGSKRLIDIEKV